MDIALDVISIAAFVISVGVLVERILRSRLRIKCSEVFYSLSPDLLWLRVIIENKSMLSISVTPLQTGV